MSKLDSQVRTSIEPKNMCEKPAFLAGRSWAEVAPICTQLGSKLCPVGPKSGPSWSQMDHVDAG